MHRHTLIKLSLVMEMEEEEEEEEECWITGTRIK